MAIPAKLPFPEWTLTIPCTINLDAIGVGEDGEPIPAVHWTGLVAFSEKARTTMNAEGKLVRLQGSVIVKGDVAPGLADISTGTVVIPDRRPYTIHKLSRPRNPDGSVHHSTLELL